MMNAISKIVNGSFSKNALPYWCLFLLDCAIVLVCGLLSFWVFNRTVMLFMERFDVLFTVLAFVLLSAISARLFRTYSGIVRYSSFVDLLNVAYANGLSMIMALVMTWTAEWFEIPQLSALNQTQTAITFVIATLLMWGVRVLVKTL